MDIKKIVPTIVKDNLRSNLISNDYYRKQWESQNPFKDNKHGANYNGDTEFKLGIVFDPAHYHRYFMASCRELGVSYEIIDILKDDWVNIVEKSNIKGLLVWPHLNSEPIKTGMDERLFLIQKYLKIPVYPDVEAVSILDNKRRVRDWLIANKFKVPKTWCFFDKMDAVDFVNKVDFPIVYKTIKGSVSNGVEIIKNKSRALKLINHCFGKGVHPYRMDKRNKQWDFILFQEYLEDCYEKRLIRIGDDYFAIDKVRGTTEYHSGSGLMKWMEDPTFFLNLTKKITEVGNFRCINVDFLIDKNENYYVNELHALFHGPIILNSEFKGKYNFNKETDKWEFTKGNFYRNYTTNLRVLDFIETLKLNYTIKNDWLEKPIFYELNGIKM